MAMVAGVAPCSRTIDSTSRATSRFDGRGSPWLIIVDSSATTGFPAARAAATSGDGTNSYEFIAPTILMRR